METKFGKNANAFATLVLTFFIWGSLYVAAKYISGQIHPLLIACLRCVTACFPLSFMARKHFGMKIEKEDWKYFLCIGGVGHFLSNEFLQLGIQMTGATMAALINAMMPVAVTLLAAVLLKEKITPVKCLCLALALAGTVVITNGSTSQGEMMGILLVVGSVLCWGLASVLIRRMSVKYPPILVTACSMLVGVVFHIPVGIVTWIKQPPTITLTVVLVILYLGMIGSGLAQYTWARCLSLLPASTCSLFYPLQPVFSGILGIFLLDEQFKANFFIGLALISVNVALNAWETKKAP